MRFISKIDWWVGTLLIGFTAGNLWAIVSFAIKGGLGALIMVMFFTPFTVFFFIPLWFRTYYEFGESELIIRCGLGKGMRVDYSRIVSVSGTKNPLSSPALSMDRLEIKYVYISGKSTDTVLISPKDKDGFIRQLAERNPDIAVSTDVKPITGANKAMLLISLGITVVVLIATGVMMISGMRDPAVHVYDDRVQISGMYGLSVYFSEMTSVSLIDKSMNEVYGGERVSRTNGFGGAGQSNKGHFFSTSLGSHRLFVQANTSPTIHIERRAIDIYISFRSGDKTEQLYRELIDAFSEWTG